MNEEDKAKLARQGMQAAELLKPGQFKERVQESVADAAGNVALRGLAAIGRLTGKDPERSPARARAATDVDVNRMLNAIDADDEASFEQQLREVMVRKAQQAEDTRRLDLSELRRSFPEPSQELALLVFNCVDLLEELSGDAEGQAASAAELERKEQLLSRIARLLAPKAGEALLSFVEHVVDTSRKYRSS